MNSEPASRSLLAVATAAAFTTALLTGISNAASPADERAAALDTAIPAAMQRASVPGAIVGIRQDGSEPYVRAFGVRDTTTREKMATDLAMRIGSNSKTFTVTAILMLADQGKLSLDDVIGRYVEGVPGGDQITLRQLAHSPVGFAGPPPSFARSASRLPSRRRAGHGPGWFALQPRHQKMQRQNRPHRPYRPPCRPKPHLSMTSQVSPCGRSPEMRTIATLQPSA